MNAAAESYPPREIKQPANLRQIEICSRSGLLATDKCYETVSTAAGDSVQRRTTYTEIATPSQAPTEPCNVHGEPRARLAREFGSDDLPRAALAVDLSQVTPIAIKSSTLLADKDPYNSLKPTLKPEPAPQPATETVEDQKTDEASVATEAKTASNTTNGSPPSTQTSESTSEIRKAIPVEPIRKAIPVEPQEVKPVEIRRAIPVKPPDQGDQDETPLKTAVPPRNPDE
jgi:hypothetical protein